MGRKAEMRSLFSRARAAAMAAGAACVPVPMVVRGEDVRVNGEPVAPGKRWVVDDGPCGFAWVNVRPGTSSFARWLVKNELARAAYDGGVDISIVEFNQSLMRKEAAAHAMAEVLCEGGIRASARSRID